MRPRTGRGLRGGAGVSSPRARTPAWPALGAAAMQELSARRYEALARLFLSNASRAASSAPATGQHQGALAARRLWKAARARVLHRRAPPRQALGLVRGRVRGTCLKPSRLLLRARGHQCTSVPQRRSSPKHGMWRRQSASQKQHRTLPLTALLGSRARSEFSKSAGSLAANVSAVSQPSASLAPSEERKRAQLARAERDAAARSVAALRASHREALANGARLHALFDTLRVRCIAKFGQVHAAVQQIDSRNALLSHTQLRTALQKLGLGLSAADVDLVLCFMDRTNSGCVGQWRRACERLAFLLTCSDSPSCQTFVPCEKPFGSVRADQPSRDLSRRKLRQVPRRLTTRARESSRVARPLF